MPVFECPDMPKGNRKKLRILQQEKACAVLLLHYTK